MADSLENRNTEDMNYPKEKDELLKTFIQCPDVNWDIPMISQNVLKNLSLEEIHNILLELKKFKEPVANFTEHHVSISGYTKTFIEKGGFTKLSEIENTKVHQNQKKEFYEFEKMKVDLELSKKILEEYPYTKWFARISLFIVIVLAILEIIQWKNK